MAIKENKYLVSMILPVYNVDRFLAQCLTSILKQTYKNLEIIIVDDGSTDNSGKIADDFSLKDPRINVLHCENRGVSVARNIGIENATGEFISFIDSDDYLENDFVEYMIGIYDTTQAELCFSMNNFTTKDTKQVKKDNITIFSAEETVAELLYPRVRMGVWNKLWKKDFIDKYDFRFIPGQYTAEGLAFMTNAAQYINCAGVGLKKVYYYRLDNDNSATTKANVERNGVGSLKAMDVIEQKIDLSSNVIKNAMAYQRWGTSVYTLRQIIDADAKNEYRKLYDDLIKYIRKNSLKMLSPQKKLPLRMRIIAILRWLNPVLLTKLSLYLRNKHLEENHGSKNRG